MGSLVNDCDFSAMIMNSLPDSFRTLLHTTTATICASGHIPTSSAIISVVFGEADHRNIGRMCQRQLMWHSMHPQRVVVVTGGRKTPTRLALAAIVLVISQGIVGERGEERKARGLIRSQCIQPTQPLLPTTLHLPQQPFHQRFCYDRFSLPVGDRTENGLEVGKILTAAHRKFSGCAGKPKCREQDQASPRRRGHARSGTAEE